MRSMFLVVDLIDLVTKHKSGELRCPATALIFQLKKLLYFLHGRFFVMFHGHVFPTTGSLESVF